MYQRTVLPNGIRIVTETIPHVRSAAIGFWYRAGSRDETPEKNGISHLIEHLMFKGTKNRTAKEIAEEIDAAGGQMNAYTSKEHTCYYARVLDEHVDLAIEILADMLLNSVFAPGEMEKEKGVILEEIKMYEDSPDEIVHDLFAEAAFAGHPLGQSVLGHEETVKAIRREDVLAYIDQRYVGENLVVAAAGRLVHDEIVEMVQRWFGGLPRGSGNDRAIPPNKAFPLRIQPKETEQVHLCVGARSFPRNHADRYAVHVIDVALGGGMSSRFFQELREERGLVYSTYSYHASFQETGLFTIYAGVSPANLLEVLHLIRDGLDRVVRDGLEPAELQRAKEQLKGSLMLGLENTANRMSRIAQAELFDEELLTPDQLIETIDRVSLDDVHRVLRELFGGDLVVAAVGPLREDELHRALDEMRVRKDGRCEDRGESEAGIAADRPDGPPAQVRDRGGRRAGSGRVHRGAADAFAR